MCQLQILYWHRHPHVSHAMLCADAMLHHVKLTPIYLSSYSQHLRLIAVVLPTVQLFRARLYVQECCYLA